MINKDECYDCGSSGALWEPVLDESGSARPHEITWCAPCAANRASDGELIQRVEEDDE